MNFEKFSESCLEILQKVEDGILSGYTSVLVIAEVLHRLMIIEASTKLGIPSKNILQHLKANPEKLTNLTQHIISYELIKKMGIKILPVDTKDISLSIDLKMRYKLFTNDAINLSVMRNNGILLIATNDPDFERVDFITVYKPFQK